MIGSGARLKAGGGVRRKVKRTPSQGSLESAVSLGDQSMEPQIIFKKDEPQPFPEDCASCDSKDIPDNFSRDDEVVNPGPEWSREQDLDHVFETLEETIRVFVKEELNRLKSILRPQSSEVQPGPVQDGDFLSHSEAFLKTTLHLLRLMKREDLSESLHSKTVETVCEQRLKSHLKSRFSQVFEGVAKAGSSALLQQIYTELYVTEGGGASEAGCGASEEAAISCEDIFKRRRDSGQAIRTVLTKGVAGVGKTVLTQKISLDWAEGRSNQDVQLLLPFTFRELNVMKDRRLSLKELLQHCFSQTKELRGFEDLQILFILDGLDECRLPLDFVKTRVLTDPTERASVEELLVNLLRGNLLPSARLWITTRPAAANQIPAECVSMVTEVRGFTDRQKEQFFRRRIPDEQQASAVISHIRSIRSLYGMCYIPVFCWLLCTVLENIMKLSSAEQLPHTLTQMYAHFLVVQAKVQIIKYHEASGADLHWTEQTREMVRSLGKLAFEQLLKGNLIFYESDLSESGLNAAEVARYSGVFTQVFREEPGLYQDKVYCFIHLSVQEFLAALHVHQTFTESGLNLLQPEERKKNPPFRPKSALRFYRCAVERALRSPRGHLDMFLRFLLGLSLPTNQRLLRGLLAHTGGGGGGAKLQERLIRLVRQQLPQQPLEKTMNLFHCLNELHDPALSSQVQSFLLSGRVDAQQLSSSQWTTLTFLLLSSEKHMEEFDLRKFGASEEALLHLLPVVQNCTKAVLSGCGVSWRGCQALSSLLRCPSSALRELDLSNNDLNDCEVQLLSAGLTDPQCCLQTLSLSGCGVSSEGCAALASALTSNSRHLKELDLSYNHPGERGVKLLSALLSDPHGSLSSLRFDHCGALRLTAGPRKFFCPLTLDPLTAFRKLRLTSDLRGAASVRALQPYPDLPDLPDLPTRFDSYPQVLCARPLPPRCYWEVLWAGVVDIAVAHGDIRRKGNRPDCRFGMNPLSWRLSCSRSGFTVWHDSAHYSLGGAPQGRTAPARTPQRVAVFLDAVGGALSFFRVSGDQSLTPLHTFTSCCFSQPLFAGFGFGPGFGINSGADSVALVEPESVLGGVREDVT